MLKYILCVAVFVLIVAEAVTIVEFKNYIKKHENEKVSDNMNALLIRIVLSVVILLFAGITATVIVFI